MRSQKPLVLSKTVLEMKFMKRTKERVKLEEAVAAEAAEAAGERGLYKNEITDEMRRGTKNVCIAEPSLAACLNLLDGRRSYRGMNPEVERLTQLAENPPAIGQVEMEVSDQQMAQFYNPLVDTVHNKFNAKRNNTNSRKATEEDNDGDEQFKSRKSGERKTNRLEIKKKAKKRKFLKPNPE